MYTTNKFDKIVLHNYLLLSITQSLFYFKPSGSAFYQYLDLEGLMKGSTVCQEIDQTLIFVSFYPKVICMMASLILCCIVFHSSSPLNPYCKLIEVHLHVMKLHGDKRKRQMRLLERGKGEYQKEAKVSTRKRQIWLLERGKGEY